MIQVRFAYTLYRANRGRASRPRKKMSPLRSSALLFVPSFLGSKDKSKYFAFVLSTNLRMLWYIILIHDTHPVPVRCKYARSRIEHRPGRLVGTFFFLLVVIMRTSNFADVPSFFLFNTSIGEMDLCSRMCGIKGFPSIAIESERMSAKLLWPIARANSTIQGK